MNTEKYKSILNHYIHNVFQYNEISDTETRILLENFCNYVLSLNNLNPDKYIIEIHPIKNMDYSVEAFMTTDEKLPNKFYVYLKKELFALKTNKYRLKMDKHSKVNLIVDFSQLLFSAAHEFQHIVQFIKAPKKSYMDLEFVEETYDYSQRLIEQKVYSNKKNRKLNKLIQHHVYISEYTSSAEKDADRMALNYIQNLLYELSQLEDSDMDYQIFLAQTHNFIGRIQKEREDIYKKYHKEHTQLKRIIPKNFDLSEEDLFIP